jgi:hypothetical protein
MYGRTANDAQTRGGYLLLRPNKLPYVPYRGKASNITKPRGPALDERQECIKLSLSATNS